MARPPLRRFHSGFPARADDSDLVGHLPRQSDEALGGRLLRLHGSPRGHGAALGERPQGFLKDLAMRSLDLGQSEGRNVYAALRDLCTYHEHDEQDRKCQSAECSWESVVSTMAPQT